MNCQKLDSENNKNNNGPKRICLGVPLDMFFDRHNNKLVSNENAIKTGEASYKLPGGIVLPDEHNSGTGNIIIRGRPGSGKSILAMQMAQKCCEREINGNQFFSWFIALEESPENVRRKSASFGWNEYFHCVHNLSELNELTNPEEYGKILHRILTKNSVVPYRPECENCPIEEYSSFDDEKYCPIHKGGKACYKDSSHAHKPQDEYVSQVYISRLSPRHLSPVTEGQQQFDVFEERFKQLENLLSGAKWLRDNKDKYPKLPQLGMVCIDSLNVLGDHLLTREQLYRLMELFKQNQIIGVFVLEEDERQVISPDSRLHGDVIEFLADVVIAMQYGEDAGYFMRYFEIVKCRHQHQVYGKHPFKISGNKEGERKKQGEKPENKKDNLVNVNMPVQTGIVIYPSLHFIVYGTGVAIEDDKNQRQ